MSASPIHPDFATMQTPIDFDDDIIDVVPKSMAETYPSPEHAELPLVLPEIEAPPKRRPSNGWLGRLFAAGMRRLDSTHFRRLAMQLEVDLPEGKTAHTLVITSAVADDQTCGAAAALAFSLAEEFDKRVLLIEGAITPAMSDRIESAQTKGLLDLLADDGNAGEDIGIRAAMFIKPTDHDRVFVLPGGVRQSDRPARLRYNRLASVVAAVRDHYDYVLIQAGPVLEDPSARALAGIADRVLLLATEDRTRLEHLDASRTALAEAKSGKVGIVLLKPRRGWMKKK